MPKRYSRQFRKMVVELAQIMNNIETFTDEMETKFITGAEDIDASWDSYIEQLHNFGIDRAIEIKQAAY